MPEKPGATLKKPQNKVGRQVLLSLKSERVFGVFKKKRCFWKYDKIKRILTFKFSAHRWSLSL